MQRKQTPLEVQSNNQAGNLVVVLISANSEWRAVRKLLPLAEVETSPYGEWFSITLPDLDTQKPGHFPARRLGKNRRGRLSSIRCSAAGRPIC